MKRNVILAMLVIESIALTACGRKADYSQQLNEQAIIEETAEASEEENVEEEIKESNEEAVEESDEEVIEETTEEDNAEEKEEEKTEEDGEANSNTISPEFKAAMDEYEKFYDDYCEFMKKYTSSSNPMDTVTMLEDYTKMVQQMEEMDKKFAEWGSKDMTEAEAAYYIEVTGRVQKKLLDVAN